MDRADLVRILEHYPGTNWIEASLRWMFHGCEDRGASLREGVAILLRLADQEDERGKDNILKEIPLGTLKRATWASQTMPRQVRASDSPKSNASYKPANYTLSTSPEMESSPSKRICRNHVSGKTLCTSIDKEGQAFVDATTERTPPKTPSPKKGVPLKNSHKQKLADEPSGPIYISDDESLEANLGAVLLEHEKRLVARGKRVKLREYNSSDDEDYTPE